MKRVYHKGQRSEVQKHAMELYIETRARIRKNNPGLLSSIKAKLLIAEQGGPEQIDRQKNLQTISAMLNLSKRSPDFQDKIQKMMLNSGA